MEYTGTPTFKQNKTTLNTKPGAMVNVPALRKLEQKYRSEGLIDQSGLHSQPEAHSQIDFDANFLSRKTDYSLSFQSFYAFTSLVWAPLCPLFPGCLELNLSASALLPHINNWQMNLIQRATIRGLKGAIGSGKSKVSYG